MKTSKTGNAVTLIFPHQLFKTHPAVSAAREVFLVEEWLFFNQYQFIKQKLVMHRASMQFYKSYLEQQHKVTYIEAIDEKCDIRKLIAFFAAQGITELHYTEVSDDWLEKRIVKFA